MRWLSEPLCVDAPTQSSCRPGTLLQATFEYLESACAMVVSACGEARESWTAPHAPQHQRPSEAPGDVDDLDRFMALKQPAQLPARCDTRDVRSDPTAEAPPLNIGPRVAASLQRLVVSMG